jgi:lysosomal acid phosphatase
MVSNVLGVLVLARNGDRIEYYQNPKTYSGAFTETTALGAVSFTCMNSWKTSGG